MDKQSFDITSFIGKQFYNLAKKYAFTLFNENGERFQLVLDSEKIAVSILDGIITLEDGSEPIRITPEEYMTLSNPIFVRQTPCVDNIYYVYWKNKELILETKNQLIF